MKGYKIAETRSGWRMDFYMDGLRVDERTYSDRRSAEIEAWLYMHEHADEGANTAQDRDPEGNPPRMPLAGGRVPTHCAR